MGYTRSSEHNTNNATNNLPAPNNFDIASNVYELSASYVAQKQLNHKLSGFTELGAGMLSFLPVHRGASAINYAPLGIRAFVPPVTFRPMGVFGIGVDYHFNPQLALRAEYRAQLYKYADFGIGLPKLYTVSSEPTVSLTYTFGKKKYRR